MEQKGLTTRQHRLKDFLEQHFISGKYWSIEEICENVKYGDGTPCYILNTDKAKHDKQIQLSADVRAINWNCVDGYKIIIKDKYGGMKLCESEEELNTWKNKELAKVERKYQYLNNLKYKANRDGQAPIYNQALNENKENKITQVYAREKVVPSGKYAGMTMAELMVAGMKDSFNNN